MNKLKTVAISALNNTEEVYDVIKLCSEVLTNKGVEVILIKALH